MLIYSASLLTLLALLVLLACFDQWRNNRSLSAEVKRNGAGLAVVSFIFGALGYWRARADLIESNLSSQLPATLFGLAVAAVVAGGVIYCVCCQAVAWNSGLHGDAFFTQRKGTGRLRLFGTFSIMILLSSCYSVAVLYFSGAISRLSATVSLTSGGFIGVIGAAFFEEIYFRGWIQNRLAKWIGKQMPAYGSHLSVWLTAIFFAALHFQGPVKFLQVFPLGLLFGYVARRYGFAAAMLIHTGSNCLHEILVWVLVQATAA